MIANLNHHSFAILSIGKETTQVGNHFIFSQIANLPSIIITLKILTQMVLILFYVIFPIASVQVSCGAWLRKKGYYQAAGGLGSSKFVCQIFFVRDFFISLGSKPNALSLCLYYDYCLRQK